MKNGPEGKEFTPPASEGKSGGGVTGKVDGSPSDSIALEHAPKIKTFGYNTKNSAAHEQERAEHYRNRYSY